MVKNLPANAADLARGREDPLEKEMAAHSNVLAWEIPWTEQPGSYNPWEARESDMTEQRNNNNTGTKIF